MRNSPKSIDVSNVASWNWLAKKPSGWLQQDINPAWISEMERSWLVRGRLDQQTIWQRSEPTVETWLVTGGRGAGKTRLGAEWVNALANGYSPLVEGVAGRIALIGETLADVREVMVEGASGIVTVARLGRPRYEASRRRVVWESGAVAQAFSSEDPESLRGPQFAAAWCDEAAKWKNAEATFDMLQFGLRLSPGPVQLVTTTPRPVPLVKRLLGDDAVRKTRLSTADNAENLAPGFIGRLTRRYGSSKLARQELGGELIEDREDALWKRETIEKALAAPRGERRRTLVAIDPPATSGRASSACGIVVAAALDGGRALVLEDASVTAASPRHWAMKAVAAYRRHEADAILAEVNQGGEMVAAVLKAVDAGVPVRAVRASRGKWLRAEPVAALYEQERVAHAKRFPALEDEMCDFGPDGLSSGRSPDRLDALVWALTELLLKGGEPHVRAL